MQHSQHQQAAQQQQMEQHMQQQQQAQQQQAQQQQQQAQYAQQFQQATYFSIDVECVATGVGHNARDVAQIAVVDQYERCLLNVYVQPPPDAVVGRAAAPRQLPSLSMSSLLECGQHIGFCP
jgi:membrane protease subunit (stomatin/prohibitin family)